MTLLFILLTAALSTFAQPIIPGLPYTEGNKLTHLSEGRALHAARLDLIKNAKSSIYFSTFTIGPDEAGIELYERLCERAQEGLEVRFTVDHRSSKDFYPYTSKLKNCGAHVLSFRPGSRFFALHEKMLMADGEKAIIGGSNYSNKYHLHHPDSHLEDSDLRQIRSLGWYDSDYLIEGPAACHFHVQYQLKFNHLAKIIADYNPEIWWYGEENFIQMIPKLYGLNDFQPCVSVAPTGNRETGFRFRQSLQK